MRETADARPKGRPLRRARPSSPGWACRVRRFIAHPAKGAVVAGAVLRVLLGVVEVLV